MKKIYYDETNHHRKIGITTNKKLRFNDETEYFFLSAFIEIEREQLIKIDELEAKFKKLRKIPMNKELKSIYLIPKNICNLDKEQIKFLTSLFDFLKNDNKIFTLGFITKMDPFFQFFFGPKFIRNIIFDSDAYMHAFQKYLSIRRLPELNELLSSEIEVKNICKKIIKWLDEDILKTSREDEKCVFQNLKLGIKEISKYDKRKWVTNNLEWSYHETVFALENIIGEKNEKNLTLIYDSFPEIEKIWDEINVRTKNLIRFKAVSEHSKTNLGLRITDWFIGFMRKMIINLNEDSISARKIYNETNSINVKTLNFINSNRDLFIAFWKVFTHNYWSTFSTLYSDDFFISIKTLQLLEEKGVAKKEEIMTLLKIHLNQNK